MAANGAGITWELLVRLAARSGKLKPEDFLFWLSGLAREVSVAAVLAVARQPFDEHELEYSIVKNRVRAYVNKRTPVWAFCTAGVTAIEISPSGLYGRCPKTDVRRMHLGDLRDDGPLKVLELAGDDLGCSIRCPHMMCFTNNVLRGTDRADFKSRIAKEGVRGVYGSNRRGYHSEVFIRWKITDVCNYTCAYCTDWRSVNKKGMELTDAEVLAAAGRIVGQFERISLRLTGGEPSARRCYVDLMRFIHCNLDHFTDIEIRTNLSYEAKHKEVLSWGWNGKLHLHIGCHIRDKNFMPWRTAELLRGVPDADYVLKFVSTPTIRDHVAFFRQYFVDHGIPRDKIRIVEEVRGQQADMTELEESPPARRTLEQRLDFPLSAVAAVSGKDSQTGHAH